MATAKNLEVGQTYPVRSGRFEGQSVKILNKVPVPDGKPNQRKVRAQVVETGRRVWILPREVEDGLPRRSGVRAPRAEMLTAPLNASAVRELAKILTRNPGLNVKLAIIGDFTEDEIARIRAAVEA